MLQTYADLLVHRRIIQMDDGMLRDMHRLTA